MLTSDRGYTTLELVRYCVEQEIPYMGTIQQRFLTGNYPKFPDDDTARRKREDPDFVFEKRVYYFKIKNETIYLR